MPLSEQCQQFEGNTLVVVPIYGYGWSRYEANDGDHQSATPRRFDMKVREFWRLEGKICGGIGTIEGTYAALPGVDVKESFASTELQGLSVFFWIRDGNGQVEFDLTKALGRYDFWIGKGTPKAKAEYAIPSGDRAQFESWPVFQGSGYMAATLDALKASAGHLGKLLN